MCIVLAPLCVWIPLLNQDPASGKPGSPQLGSIFCRDCPYLNRKNSITARCEPCLWWAASTALHAAHQPKPITFSLMFSLHVVEINVSESVVLVRFHLWKTKLKTQCFAAPVMRGDVFMASLWNAIQRLHNMFTPFWQLVAEVNANGKFNRDAHSVFNRRQREQVEKSLWAGICRVRDTVDIGKMRCHITHFLYWNCSASIALCSFQRFSHNIFSIHLARCLSFCSLTRDTVRYQGLSYQKNNTQLLYNGDYSGTQSFVL